MTESTFHLLPVEVDDRSRVETCQKVIYFDGGRVVHTEERQR